MAHDGLGQCLSNRGHLDEAIDHFQMALNIAPGYREIETNLMLALAKKGRTDEAIAANALDRRFCEARAECGVVEPRELGKRGGA